MRKATYTYSRQLRNRIWEFLETYPIPYELNLVFIEPLENCNDILSCRDVRKDIYEKGWVI